MGIALAFNYFLRFSLKISIIPRIDPEVWGLVAGRFEAGSPSLGMGMLRMAKTGRTAGMRAFGSATFAIVKHIYFIA
jgi:hypothetical protein